MDLAPPSAQFDLVMEPDPPIAAPRPTVRPEASLSVPSTVRRQVRPLSAVFRQMQNLSVNTHTAKVSSENKALRS